MVGDDFEMSPIVVVLWWRDDDGDLVDALVDALSAITSGGVVWLFTPKAGRDGHVEPSEIGEAARTAGLSSTKSISAAADWAGTRLVAPKLGPLTGIPHVTEAAPAVSEEPSVAVGICN